MSAAFHAQVFQFMFTTLCLDTLLELNFEKHSNTCLFVFNEKFTVSKFNEHTNTIISWKKKKRTLSHPYKDWISKRGQTRLCLFLTRCARAEFHVSNFGRYKGMVIFRKRETYPFSHPPSPKSRISRNVRTPVCLFLTSSSYAESATSVNIKIRLNCFKKMLPSSRYPFGVQTSFLRHKTSILSTFQISDCS